ncbi:potassium-transporting ATPase subunit F [Devriesea agamarum]|nr:potassium-transporting ATPase subunit F [Devriesea agamarum]
MSHLLDTVASLSACGLGIAAIVYLVIALVRAEKFS